MILEPSISPSEGATSLTSHNTAPRYKTKDVVILQITPVFYINNQRKYYAKFIISIPEKGKAGIKQF